MIIGECPYCNVTMHNFLFDGPLPKFQKLTAECCGNVVWLRHSRVNPQAYSEVGFAKEHEVNEETKEVVAKDDATGEAHSMPPHIRDRLGEVVGRMQERLDRWKTAKKEVR